LVLSHPPGRLQVRSRWRRRRRGRPERMGARTQAHGAV